MARLSSIASAVAAASVSGFASAAWSDGDPGIDRMYSDITQFNMSTNTTLECYNACAADSSCVGWSMIPAGQCNSGGPAVCFTKYELGTVQANACRIFGVMPSQLLNETYSTPLVGQVQPQGWLQDELNIQAESLSGHLSLFWADIQDSIWIGGTADGGLHERGPYWLNGIVPLTFQINNTNVTGQMQNWINYILANQLPSGWLGPDDMPTNGDEYWSRYNVLQSLLQFWEATNDARVMPAMFSYMKEARRRLMGAGALLGDWAVVRAQDWIMTMFKLIDHAAAGRNVFPPGYSESFLLNLADVIHAQMLANGGDWKTWFDTPIFPEGPACVPGAPCDLLTHGVNIGQAIKSEAVWYRHSGDYTDVNSTYIRIGKLDKYHGVPSGLYQADEHLAGNQPMHGTEVCAVVEAIFSYSVSADIIGDAMLYERAEKIAYNGLPGTMTKDMWAHQYLQQANEINAMHTDPHVFYTDGDDSTIYGLQPNYGCCTANFNQGWPKFAQRMIKGVNSNGGVAVAMWGPVTATVPLSGVNAGQSAAVNVTTDYPFGDSATVTITGPASMPVSLRVPSWATTATVSINGGAQVPIGSSAGGWYSTALPSASIRGAAGVTTSTFVVSFNPTIRVETTWYNNSAAVFRGAILYGLEIGQNQSVLASYAFESKDYQVLPTTAWNYALYLVDPTNPGATMNFTQASGPNAEPFDGTNPSVYITAQARLVNSWGIQTNAAAAPPTSPIDCDATSGACGPVVNVRLVPYGTTLLRISVIPWTQQSS